MREAMAHMFVNCTLSANNDSVRSCNRELLKHWTGLSQGDVSIFTSLALYFLVFVSTAFSNSPKTLPLIKKSTLDHQLINREELSFNSLVILELAFFDIKYFFS
jgi:hypothetical protein